MTTKTKTRQMICAQLVGLHGALVPGLDLSNRSIQRASRRAINEAIDLIMKQEEEIARLQAAGGDDPESEDDAIENAIRPDVMDEEE